MLYSSCSMNSVWIHVIERRDVNIKIRRLYTGESSRGMHSWSPFPGPKFNDVDSLFCTCSSQWRYRKHIKIMSPMVMATAIMTELICVWLWTNIRLSRCFSQSACSFLCLFVLSTMRLQLQGSFPQYPLSSSHLHLNLHPYREKAVDVVASGGQLVLIQGYGKLELVESSR